MSSRVIRADARRRQGCVAILRCVPAPGHARLFILARQSRAGEPCVIPARGTRGPVFPVVACPSIDIWMTRFGRRFPLGSASLRQNIAGGRRHVEPQQVTGGQRGAEWSALAHHETARHRPTITHARATPHPALSQRSHQTCFQSAAHDYGFSGPVHSVGGVVDAGLSDGALMCSRPPAQLAHRCISLKAQERSTLSPAGQRLGIRRSTRRRPARDGAFQPDLGRLERASGNNHAQGLGLQIAA